MTKHGDSSSSSASDMESLFSLPTVDLVDRLKAMTEVERRPHYRCRDYLSDARSSSAASTSRSCASRRSRQRRPENTTVIAPSSRAKIVRWLYDCVDYLDLSRDCVAMAASYVDRFMSRYAPGSRLDADVLPAKNAKEHRKTAALALRDAAAYQLLAVSALLVASKQSDGHSRADVDADVLAEITRGSYDADEILDGERTLLDGLDWRLCGPTATQAAGHCVALLARQRRRSRRGRASGRREEDEAALLASAADFARLQAELSAADHRTCALRLPSEVGLAAVLNAAELLDFSDGEMRAFRRTLRERCGMDPRSEGVEGARDELHRAFDRQKGEVVGRAGRSEASSRSCASVFTAAASAPIESEFVTPRSSATSGARRSKGRRRRRAQPSPTCVDAKPRGRVPLEP